MADLENMLLEAAGRTSKSGRKTQSDVHAKWPRGSSCSDGSDSDNNDSRFSIGKHSGCNVPLKKRFEHSKNPNRTSCVNGNSDDDKSSGDDSDSAPSIGSDLYKDDKDKEELGKMTELDREMILAERSTKIDDYRLKKKAQESLSKAEYSTKVSPPPLSSRSRLSVRSEKVSAKTDALNELRAKRMKQQDPNKFRDLAVAGTGFFDDNEGSSDSDEEDKFQGHNYVAENSDDLLTSDSKPLSFEDVKEITIQRSRLVKWYTEPFFEDVIVGCFVRVGVARTRTGPKYRLCLVKGVDASDPNQQYKLEGRTTHKWLNCTWGSETAADRWQMAEISDSPPLEEEFIEFVAEVDRVGGKLPNRHDVNDKKGKIQEISNFVYSAETVKLMLEQKKSTSTRPLNIAAEKDRLRKEIEAAESRGEDWETVSLQAKLKELVELSRQSEQLDAKGVKLAEMNRKNKVANFRNASERRPINTSLKAGEEGYDPFSRRWTRSRNYYPSKPGEVPDEANVSANRSSVDVNGVGTSKGGEAGKLVDTNAPVDQETELNLLHIFELPISLAGLQSFGGPHGVSVGFMSRRQKIEATIGGEVPENDGKRHSLTLSVSDYKRRRGLL